MCRFRLADSKQPGGRWRRWRSRRWVSAAHLRLFTPGIDDLAEKYFLISKQPNPVAAYAQIMHILTSFRMFLERPGSLWGENAFAPEPALRLLTRNRALLILAIIAAMEDQTEEPLDAADLAKLGGISVRQMERLFAEKLNQRPMGFYLGLRLEKAERLITYSRLSMRDVSMAVGFSSLAQFSRAFRARYGKAPSGLRNPNAVIPAKAGTHV